MSEVSIQCSHVSCKNEADFYVYRSFGVSIPIPMCQHHRAYGMLVNRTEKLDAEHLSREILNA